MWTYIIAVIKMFAGLGAFLIGFKILSENIEKLANSGLKKLFNKTSKNRFIGVGIGALVTAIIQSSSAATVMIVGFVNAGVMDLFQATAMIMGANIGTTITAQIVSLNAIPVAEVLMIFAFIGLFGSMFAKREKTKTIFMSLSGLGLVFLALEFMSDSMNVFRNSDAFTTMLSSINNPFLLMFIGLAITAILQSSSAVTTIIISMLMAGLTIGRSDNSNAVLYVILGTNIGTCITALLSSIGANPNAKRASLIHLMFNVFGALIFFIILLCWPTFMDDTFKQMFPGVPGTQIAMFHTFFNVTVTLIFIPFVNIFVKISNMLIKDKNVALTLSYLDDRFLKTPSIAIEQASKETLLLGEKAVDCLNRAIDSFLLRDNDKAGEILDEIALVEKMNDEIISYLLKISSVDISVEDEKYISALHRILIDFGREAEIADNLIKYTKKAVNENLSFSSAVKDGITDIKEKLNNQFDNISNLFESRNKNLLKQSDIIESEIDKLRSELIDAHIKRLEDGKCSPSSNTIFISLISNLERAGDHLNYIAHSLYEYNN